MKKKLVVLLAVVMMFAFAATAYAADFTDISEQPVVVQDAVAKTTALGIIEGYTDGTFGPEQNITRAEFAKIAVTAAGAKDTATMLEKNASSFKDVKAGVWYTGWINASESLGIFQGDGNGNFRPNDSISNQEVVTVLMRLLGYNDNLTGTWPTNYITQANKDGILDNVAIVAAAAAKRADVVVMLDDALDTDIVTYDKDTNEFVKKQVGISDSRNITLLADSFKGAYYEVNRFDAVTQVRDVAKQTLNWSVRYNDVYADGSDTKTANLIIDKETKVSHNGGTLFDLQDHQGKVYFVEQNDKLYARFIEVESYTKTVSDQPKTADDSSKVTVGKTNYNKADGYRATDAVTQGSGSKNSNFILYFNDDDQVYYAKSDQDYKDNQTYYVKSVGSSSVKLVHNVTTSTKNMKDDDTLIWTGDEFVGPSALKAGDAIMWIADDLYVKVDEVTGELTKSTSGTQSKVTIGGKTYVYDPVNTTSYNAYFIDDEFNDAGVDLGDVYGNTVKYILDKDNTIAAIMVDDTSTGTTLYGIVVDGGEGTSSWAKGFKNITLFTAEGKTVSYDMASDPTYFEGKVPDVDWLGMMVSYQLNKDGEIKEILPIGTVAGVKNGEAFATGEIQVKNNAYLVDKNDKSVTLAQNVVIFEVDVNDGDVDPSIVPRAQLLGGGDFTPENLTDLETTKEGFDKINAYAVYETNSNGAIKALAYTSGSGSNLLYGVATSWNFGNADNKSNVTLLDGNTYELGNHGHCMTAPGDTAYGKGSNDDVLIYKLSGDKVNVVATYGEKDALSMYAKEVKGFNDGLISFDKDAMESLNFAKAQKTGTADYDKEFSGYKFNGYTMGNVMTDSDTAVFVINSSTGKYEVGSLEDISAGVYAYVAVVDKDGYADLVLVDNYHDYDKNKVTK